MTEVNNFVSEPQYLKIVFKALIDPLVEYLLPKPVMFASPLLWSKCQELMKTETHAGNAEMIQDLVQCLAEDESEDAELILELRSVLHKLQCHPHEEYIKYEPSGRHDIVKVSTTLVDVFNGSFMRQLSEGEAKMLCLSMTEKRILSEKSYELAVEKGNAYEICLEVLKGIRPKKPEWPFEFMKCLENIQALHNNKDLKVSTEISEVIEKNEEHHEQNSSDEPLNSDIGDESYKNDLNLREYQIELAQNALEGKNTIIYSPTGSGKTRVAIHVISEHLRNGKGFKSKSKKKVAFLAPNGPLVEQHVGSLSKYLPYPAYKLLNLTGDSDQSKDLHKLLDLYDVFVMTPRILENHLTKENIPNLTKFSLLVFDECQHTRKGESYNSLMLSYLQMKSESPDVLPQVVGLTASIGAEKAESISKMEENVLKICSSLDAECISMVKNHQEEMKSHVAIPKEEVHELKERRCSDIEKIIKELELYALKNIEELNRQDLKKHAVIIPQDKKTQQYSQWVVDLEKKANIHQPQGETNSLIPSLSVIAQYLKEYNVALQLYDLVEWPEVLNFLKERFRCICGIKAKENLTKTEQFCYKLFEEAEQLKRPKSQSNENLEIVKKQIKKNLREKDAADGKKNGSRGIIFVQTKFLAYSLKSWIEENEDVFLQDLKTSVLTGKKDGMTVNQQKEIMQQFKSGKLRLLVATPFAQEGLDIPECNLVIKYNHVGNEVTTVQTRGRSRQKGGKSILLAFDKIYRKEIVNQCNAEWMEQAVINVSNMSKHEIRQKIEKNQSEILKDAKIAKIDKGDAKISSEYKDFKMVCKKCTKAMIDSKDIRKIKDSHHVVVSREFMSQYDKLPEKSRGAQSNPNSCLVTCKGRLDEQAVCGNVLGSLMIYKKVSFVQLKIENFGILWPGCEQVQYYKKWKDMCFSIDKIQSVDIERYLPDHNTSLNERSSGVEGKSPIVKIDSETGQGASNSEEGLLNQTNHTDISTTAGSVTQAKTVAQLPESAARVPAQDSGSLSIKISGNTANQSTTLPKMPSNIENEDAVGAAGTATNTRQQNQYLAETQDRISIFLDNTSDLSIISTFVPRESKSDIEKPESSFSFPLISPPDTDSEDDD